MLVPLVLRHFAADPVAEGLDVDVLVIRLAVIGKPVPMFAAAKGRAIGPDGVFFVTGSEKA